MSSGAAKTHRENDLIIPEVTMSTPKMETSIRCLLLVFLIPACLSVSSSSSSTPATSTTTTSTQSPSNSSTPSAAPSTLPRPDVQHEQAVFSIRTFDFSKKKQSTTPEPVEICFTDDMCKTMPGICHKGTCQTKKCSTDIICLCEPGFTGQFCDRNMSEVQNVDVKIVKGKIVSTTPSSKPNGNGKTHVNGHIDHTLINSQHDKGPAGLDPSQKNGVTKDKVNGQRETKPLQDNPSLDTTAKTTNNINSSKNNGKVTSNSASTNTESHTNSVTKTEEKPSTASPDKSQTETRIVAPDGSYRKGPEAVVRSDNSPLKVTPSEQEVQTSVPSVIKEKSESVKIPSVSVERNRVGIVFDSLLGPPASKKNKPKQTSKKKSKLSDQNKENKGTTPDPTTESVMSKAPIHNEKTTVTAADPPKEKVEILNINVDLHPPELKDNATSASQENKTKSTNTMNVVPAVDSIEKAKNVLLSQKSGTVDVTNDLVTGHALFENKEITITIEKTVDATASNAKAKGKTNKGFSKSGENTVPKSNTDTGKSESPLKQTTSNKEIVKESTQKGTRQTKTETTTMANTNSKSQLEDSAINKMDAVTSKSSDTTSKVTKTIDVTQQIKDGHLKETKAKNSTDFNPLLQLLNIIGSREFVDHVSAVKIEIITKVNTTEKTVSTNKREKGVSAVDNELKQTTASSKEKVVPVSATVATTVIP